MVGGVSSHDPVSVIHVESRSIRYTTNPNVPSSSRAEAALRHVSPARQQARPPVHVGLAVAQSAPGQSRGWGDPSEAAPLCISETPVGSQGRHGTPTQDRIPGRRWPAPPCLCSLGAVCPPATPSRGGGSVLSSLGCRRWTRRLVRDWSHCPRHKHAPPGVQGGVSARPHRALPQPPCF